MKTATVFFAVALFCSLSEGAPNSRLGPVDELWALEHLIAVPQEDIPQIIRQLESSGSPGDEQTKLALGILHVHQYIWHQERADSNKAHEHLMSLSAQVASTPLALVYKGMSSSFLAKRRTIFGVGDLKDMRRFFDSIPEDHPSWFIRFLRGTTLYQVGEALPSIWPLTEHKRAAQKLGQSDLEYVLDRHKVSRVRSFDRTHYDGGKTPVPAAIHKKIQQLYQNY